MGEKEIESGNPALLAVSSESVKVAVFKCDRCGCVEPLLETSERTKQIREKGFGICYHGINCRKSSRCYCHTGLGMVVKIKLKFVDYGEVPF